MYSFAPVVNNALAQAVGLGVSIGVLHFWIMGMIGCAIIDHVVSPYSEGDATRRKYYCLLGAYLILFFIAVITYPKLFMTFPEPKNEQVIGHRVNVQSSIDREMDGKRAIYVENGYVVYRVPEGLVNFRMRSGVVYPDDVILFKN